MPCDWNWRATFCMRDCISAFTVGTNVFVACDDLDDTNAQLPPRGVGKIVVIDSTNDTVTTTISMPVENPQSIFQRSPMDSMFGGDLLIGEGEDCLFGLLADQTSKIFKAVGAGFERL